jgi:alkylation response protein AidB-like acyl-CoA dehydrogenase
MELNLSAEDAELRDRIVRFAQKELSAGALARDRAHEFPRDLWDKCGQMGLPGLPVPEDYGGPGLSPLSCAVALEALGYGCTDGGLSFSICAHLLACVVPIWKHGDEVMKRRYLPDLCSGRLIATNAMTEAHTGSDPFAMSTHAERHAEGYRVSGSKMFCSNGPVADLALVYAVTDKSKGYHGGITAFLVPTDAQGFSVGQVFEKMGTRTSPISELILDDVYVPESEVVGKLGGGGPIFAESMDWERALLGACHVGAMHRLLEESIRYVRTRKQFGQLIGKNQAVSHKVADMKVRLEAARWLVFRAASSLDVSREAGMYAAIAKVFVSEAFVESSRAGIQLMGGYGYMVDSQVERMMRDALGSTIYSGTSEMQRNIIARWLGL